MNRRVVPAVIAIALLWCASGATSSAQLGGQVFSASADARLVAINFTAVPGLLFDQLIDAGGAVAQAELDSLGNSRAFASDPYPSESVVLLPGLAAGLTNGQTSDVIPTYPLIASSAHPSVPDAHIAAPPLVLTARSTATTSRGDATNGLGHGEASVAIDEATGTVTALATSSAEVISLSDTISLTGVHSAAAATSTGGVVGLSSTFEVGSVDLAGQSLSLQDLLGPLAGPLDQALARLLTQIGLPGVTVDVVPETRTDTSITSAGLRIRWEQAAPDVPALPSLPELPLPPLPGLPAILALPGGVSGLESIVTEVVVGQVTASIDGRLLPAAPPRAAAPGADGGPSIEAGSPGVGEPTGGTGSGGLLNPAVPVQPTAAAPAGASPQVLAAVVPYDISIARFYPVLLVAAFACAATSILMGKLGVRST